MSNQKYISVVFNITSIAVLTRRASSPACSARLSGQKIYHSPAAMISYWEIIIPPSKNPIRKCLRPHKKIIKDMLENSLSLYF